MQIFTVTLNPGLDRTLTVPEIRFSEVLRAADLRLDWGGKGFNVSRALQALGVESVAMGFVGGATGEMLAQGLKGLGIETDFVPIDGETRTNTVIAEAGSDRYIKVNEAGPTISAQELAALFARVRSRVSDGSVWVFCGSLPPGAPVDAYAQLIATVQERGGLACLDTSGEALRRGCMVGPYLVKPNVEEAEEATGLAVRSEASIVAAVKHFQEAGVRNVAISLGADGLALGSIEGIVLAKPPPVQARTVVGVGDVLLAGLIWAWGQGATTAEVAAWGVAAGTASAMGEGVSVAALDEVRAVYERVHTAWLA
ncbi:MAG: 1-phosphofructokinase family hexose kinase [Chloroflexota bacterium]|nr:1-phosphofructokinase family hexose kinase [Chloroflexota bacterium]